MASKRIRRHSFTSLEEVAKELDAGGSHVCSPGDKEDSSSRKRPPSPSISEGSSPKRPASGSRSEHAQDKTAAITDIVCLPQGTRLSVELVKIVL